MLKLKNRYDDENILTVTKVSDNTKCTVTFSNYEYEVMDLSDLKNTYKLHKKYTGQIDLLINNAGFGECGRFD